MSRSGNFSEIWTHRLPPVVPPPKKVGVELLKLKLLRICFLKSNVYYFVNRLIFNKKVILIQ